MKSRKNSEEKEKFIMLRYSGVKIYDFTLYFLFDPIYVALKNMFPAELHYTTWTVYYLRVADIIQ